jgi:hypothetical protein
MKILSGSMPSSGGSYPEITPHPSEEEQKYLYLHAFTITTPIFCIHPMHPLMIRYMFLNVIDAAIACFNYNRWDGQGAYDRSRGNRRNWYVVL